MPSLLTLPLTITLPPLLILISLPLAFFAALTTTVAFATLFIRVSVVYVDLGAALLRSYLFPPSAKTSPSQSPRLHLSTSNASLATARRHSRRNSNASFISLQEQPQWSTRPGSVYGPGFVQRNESFASLLGAGVQGPTRDYEGIGGWRDEDDDPEREALWLGMNKRLELPAAPPPSGRWHRRSGTGSSHASAVLGNPNSSNNASQVNLSSGGDNTSKRWSTGSGFWSPETLRMSPVQSRARTPSVTDRNSFVASSNGIMDDENYFGLQMPSQKPGQIASVASSKDARRKSVGIDATKETRRGKHSSGESISSLGSKGTVRKVSHG